MRRILSLLAVLTVALFTGTAHADTFTIDFHTGSGDYSGQLVLTGTQISSGVYYITSATGTITDATTNTYNVSLVTPSSGNPGDTFSDNYGDTYNNLLYVNGYVNGSNVNTGDLFDDIGGLMIVANGIEYNIYDPYTLVPLLNGVPLSSQNVVYDSIIDTIITPEPSSLILLGTGSVAMLGAIRRRIRIA